MMLQVIELRKRRKQGPRLSSEERSILSDYREDSSAPAPLEEETGGVF